MKRPTIFTTEFIRLLAHTHHRDQVHYRRLLGEVLEGITSEVAAGRTVQLTGFGTFYTREQPAGSVTSFQTGKRQVVPAHRVAAFRVGELLKRAVQKRSVGRPPHAARSSLGAALSRAGRLFAASSQRLPRTSKR